MRLFGPRKSLSFQNILRWREKEKEREKERERKE
jgi:hypothetical protein